MKNKRADSILLICTLLLLGIGIFMVLSASSYNAMIKYKDPYYFFKRQIVWSAIGLVAMFFASRFNYKKIKNKNKLISSLFYFAAFLLGALFVTGLGKDVGGATRWLKLGPVNLTPSEFMKIAIVFYMAMLLTRKDLTKDFEGFFKLLIPLGFVCALILKQPDLGTTVVIAGSVFLMLFVGKIKIKYLLSLSLASIAGLVLLITTSKYRARRLTGFINVWEKFSDEGYQTGHSLFAFGSGGLFGAGFSNSRQKYLHLPERHTDFISAIIGEEFGFIGMIMVMALFAIFIYRGLAIAYKAETDFESYVAVGLTGIIAIQVIVNLGVALGMLPVTGITLPFVSYGGSSLVFSLIGVGLLLNISRFSKI